MPFLLILGPLFGVCAVAAFVAHGHKTLALAAEAKSAGEPPRATQHFELDRGMPEAVAHHVLTALVQSQEPAELEALARELGATYPLAASELRAKAAALAASQGGTAASPPLSHPSAAAGAIGAATPDMGEAALILQAAMRAYADETDPVSLEGFAESIRAKYPTAAILLVGRAHEFRAAAQAAADAANALPAQAAPASGGEPPASALTPAAAPPVKLGTYVVQAGDTPSAIAERLAHEARRWPELVAANPTKPTGHDGGFASLRQGETLTLPAAWSVPSAAPAQPNGVPVAAQAHP
jgi:nucleoid-associated protein YgaU